MNYRTPATPANSLLIYSSTLVLLIFFYDILLASVGFLNQLPISPYHLPLAMLLASCHGLWHYRRSLCLVTSIKTLALTATTFFLSYLLALFAYDFTGDGQDYHLSTILLLMHGWDPFTVPNAEWFIHHQLTTNIIHHDRWFLYISHYVKGYEILIASLSKLLGKMINPFALSIPMAIATYGIAYHVISKHIKKCHRYTRVAIALLIVLNPIAISQLGSSMVDGMIGYLLTLFILLSIDYVLDPLNHHLWLINLSSILIVATKLTGYIYPIIAAAIVIELLLAKQLKQAYRYAASLMLSGILAIIIVCYNPYITNIIFHHGDMFYPAVSLDNTQVKAAIPININYQFKQKNRFEKFAMSIFSSGLSQQTYPQLIFPLPVVKRLFSIQRYGGFGANYGILFILSLVFILCSRNRLFVLVNTAILITIFINPECWWARYIPQAWLLPILSLFGIIYHPKATTLSTKDIIALAVILINGYQCLPPLIPQLQFYFKAQQQFDRFAEKVNQSHLKVVIDNSYCNLGTTPIQYILRQRHVKVEYADKLHCPVANDHGAFSQIQQTMATSEKFRYCLEKDPQYLASTHHHT